MMRKVIEVTDEELAQFEPRTREALVRLWRQQSGHEERTEERRDPLKGFAQLCKETRDTFRAKVAANQRPDGTVVAQCDLKPQPEQ